MKQIFFIDDCERICKLQKAELISLLQEYNFNDVITVDSKTLYLEMEEINKYEKDLNKEKTYLNDRIKEIRESVKQSLSSGTEKIELVIDLCLDDKDPSTGIHFVKLLINNDELKEFFVSNRLIITLTSMYISADFDRLSEGVLSNEEVDKILYCYRPIKNDSFDRERYAFPEYYMQFKANLRDENIKGLLSQKTYYGNFFGLIIARLVCAEG